MFAKKMLSNNRNIEYLADIVRLFKNSPIVSKEQLNIIDEIITDKKEEKIRKAKVDFNIKEKKDTLSDLDNLAGRIQLNTFLRTSLHFENCDIILSELQTIDIFTYSDLEKSILDNKFIKLCRGEKQIIKNKEQMRIILYCILNKNNKLKPLRTEEKSITEFNIFEHLDFTNNMIIQKTNINIEELKSKYINIMNLLIFTENDKMDDREKFQNELKEIDEEINKYYIYKGEEDLYQKHIDDLLLYINNVKDDYTKKGLMNIIQSKYNESNFSQENLMKAKRHFEYNFFGENTEESNNYKKYNNDYNHSINKAIQNFEDEEDSKRNIKQEKYDKLLNDISQCVINTLQCFDNKLSVQDNKNEQDILSKFIKDQMKNIRNKLFARFNTELSGKPGYFKNDFISNSIIKIAKLYAIIYHINNKNIDLQNYYLDIDHLVQHETIIGKLVYVKSRELFGTYKNKIGNLVYIDLYDQIITTTEDDLEVVQTFIGKNVMVIKGNEKGIIGTVYEENGTHLFITKDIFGKTKDQIIPRMKLFKIKRENVKLLSQSNQYKLDDTDDLLKNNNDMNMIVKSYKLKQLDLLSLVRYCYCYTSIGDNQKLFDSLYQITLGLYNTHMNIIKNDTNIKSMKVKLLKIKKLSEQKLKEGKTVEYVKLKNVSKRLEEQLRNQMKNSLTLKVNPSFTDETGKLPFITGKEVAEQERLNNKKSVRPRKLKKIKVNKTMINGMIKNIKNNMVMDIVSRMNNI